MRRHGKFVTAMWKEVKYFLPANRDNRILKADLMVRDHYKTYSNEMLVSVRDAIDRSMEKWNRVFIVSLCFLAVATISDFWTKAMKWIVGMFLLHYFDSTQLAHMMKQATRFATATKIQDKLIASNVTGLLVFTSLVVLAIIFVQFNAMMSEKKRDLQIIEQILNK